MRFKKDGVVWVAKNSAQADAFIADGYEMVDESVKEKSTEKEESEKRVGRKPLSK